MTDFVQSFVFVFCEILLLGLVFSPFLVRGGEASAASRLRLPASTFLFGLVVGVFLTTAGMSVVSPNRATPTAVIQGDTTLPSGTTGKELPSTASSSQPLTAEVQRGRPVLIHF